MTNIGASNGLLRQYFPKGGDLRIVTDERARDVANRLNQRPRLCLDDRTPEPVNGTMATSPHSQLIRNDQWNLPPGDCQEFCVWHGVTSTASGRGLEKITHDHEHH